MEKLTLRDFDGGYTSTPNLTFCVMSVNAQCVFRAIYSRMRQTLAGGMMKCTAASLADMTGICSKTIIKYIRELSSLGVIQETTNKGSGFLLIINWDEVQAICRAAYPMSYKGRNKLREMLYRKGQIIKVSELADEEIDTLQKKYPYCDDANSIEENGSTTFDASSVEVERNSISSQKSNEVVENSSTSKSASAVEEENGSTTSTIATGEEENRSTTKGGLRIEVENGSTTRGILPKEVERYSSSRIEQVNYGLDAASLCGSHYIEECETGYRIVINPSKSEVTLLNLLKKTGQGDSISVCVNYPQNGEVERYSTTTGEVERNSTTFGEKWNDIPLVVENRSCPSIYNKKYTKEELNNKELIRPADPAGVDGRIQVGKQVPQTLSRRLKGKEPCLETLERKNNKGLEGLEGQEGLTEDTNFQGSNQNETNQTPTSGDQEGVVETQYNTSVEINQEDNAPADDGSEESESYYKWHLRPEEIKSFESLTGYEQPVESEESDCDDSNPEDESSKETHEPLEIIPDWRQETYHPASERAKRRNKKLIPFFSPTEIDCILSDPRDSVDYPDQIFIHEFWGVLQEYLEEDDDSGEDDGVVEKVAVDPNKQEVDSEMIDSAISVAIKSTQEIYEQGYIEYRGVQFPVKQQEYTGENIEFMIDFVEVSRYQGTVVYQIDKARFHNTDREEVAPVTLARPERGTPEFMAKMIHIDKCNEYARRLYVYGDDEGKRATFTQIEKMAFNFLDKFYMIEDCFHTLAPKVQKIRRAEWNEFVRESEEIGVAEQDFAKLFMNVKVDGLKPVQIPETPFNIDSVKQYNDLHGEISTILGELDTYTTPHEKMLVGG